MSDTISPTYFLLSVATCVSASLGTCCDTQEMGRAAKYWRKRSPVIYRTPYRQLFSSIGSNLCVGLIRYMLWHTRDGQSSQILEHKGSMSYRIPYRQSIFLCRCPPMCLHHYMLRHTRDGRIRSLIGRARLTKKINLPYRSSGRDCNYRLLMNRVQKVTLKKIPTKQNQKNRIWLPSERARPFCQIYGTVSGARSCYF